MVILQPQAAALNPHGHGMPRGIFPRIAQRVFLELMEKIKTFLLIPSDYGKPWYGQLMAAPQMMAYVIQTDFWLREYKVEIIM